MNYFTRREMGLMDIVSDDYPMSNRPVVGHPFMDTQQLRDVRDAWLAVSDRKISYFAFQFSVLHENGTVTVHMGETGRDDRVLI